MNENTTDLNGVKLQRLMPDPANGNPDANYFQRIQGLMNITSPTAGGKEASLLHAQGVPASNCRAAAATQAADPKAMLTQQVLVMQQRVGALSVPVQGLINHTSATTADQHPHLGCGISWACAGKAFLASSFGADLQKPAAAALLGVSWL